MVSRYFFFHAGEALILRKDGIWAGIEPANRGFAVPGLTTWLPRRYPKPLLSIDFTPLEQAKTYFA